MDAVRFIDGIYFIKSPIKHKKYRAIFSDNSSTDFGDNRYQQYYDKIGMYSHLNHYDKNRRRLYRARHNNIGSKNSASYLSYHYLW